MQQTLDTREQGTSRIQESRIVTEAKAMQAWNVDKQSASLKIRSNSPVKKRDKTNNLPTARGQEWVLLVDSNPLMAEICTEMLEHLGYHVMTALNGAEALDLVRAGSGLFHLVIADANLPGMEFAELTRELEAIRPDLPILLCSEYGEWNGAGRARAAGARAFRLKPMPIAEMAGCVRRLIDKAA